MIRTSKSVREKIKPVHDQPAHFDEEGNHVKMQVSADEDDFTSEEEGELDETGSESEMEWSVQSETEGTNESESDRSMSQIARPAQKKRKRMKRRNERRKMVQKIDLLSDSLNTLQTLMVQNGLFRNKQAVGSPSKDAKVDNAKDGKSLPWTNSETTIYRNAVQQVVQPANDTTVLNVDSKIAFNMKQNDNTDQLNPNPVSSDKHGDTSDEIMNVTNQFIADCAAEVE